jgi:hypothetical protein
MENTNELEPRKLKNMYIMLSVILILIAQLVIGAYIIFKYPPKEVMEIVSGFFIFGAKLYNSLFILLIAVAGYVYTFDSTLHPKKYRFKAKVTGITMMLGSILFILWLWTDIL